MLLMPFTEWFRRKELLLSTNDEHIRLRVRQMAPKRQAVLGSRRYSNSWSPLFYGRLAAADEASVLVGHFDVHPAVRVFMFSWLSVVALFALFAVPSGVVELARGELKGLAFVFIPTIMLAFGIILPRLGRRLGEQDKTTIVKFLTDLFGPPLRAPLT